MNYFVLYLLAVLGGMFLAAQAGLNSYLGILLKNPLLASLATFISSTLFVLIFIIFTIKEFPNLSGIKQIPKYLWFLGGLFSVLGIYLYYYTIPKLGISTMISLGLFGQLVFSFFAGHYGWLNLPTEPITIKRILGIVTMASGIILINIR